MNPLLLAVSPGYWDNRFDVIVVVSIIFVAGWLSYRNHRRKFERGEIPGVPRSKGLFDWLFFYNMRSRDKWDD